MIKAPAENAPIKRHYPDQPLVGVGAAVFKGGEVLLVRRGQEPAKDSWSLPGGLVELGETMEAAIQRELAEETGITVRLLGIAAVLERIFPDPDGRIAYHYVLMDFLCNYLDGELTPGSDITAARFVPLGGLTDFDLPQYTADVIHRAWEQKRLGTCLPLMSRANTPVRP
ncbi:MAG: NUDIX hydrolase [Desulfobaccales bacterium]